MTAHPEVGSLGEEPVVSTAAPSGARTAGRVRRWSARFLDWSLAATLTAVVCWPFAWDSLMDLGPRLGLRAGSALVTTHSLASTAGDTVGELRGIVVQVLALQVLM